MQPPEIAIFLRRFIPDGDCLSDETLLTRAGEAMQAIQLVIKREIADAFDGHDQILSVILALLVTATQCPTNAPADVRTVAANVMLQPFVGGATH